MDQSVLRWLLAEGGPAIRYRTATELLPDTLPVAVDRLAQALLASPKVGRWLTNLMPGTSPTQLHGSKPTCFENAAAKLTLLGCRAGMAPFDERMAFARAWLAKRASSAPSWEDQGYYRMLVAARLAAAGYDGEGLRHVIRERLIVLSAWARQGDYDIYIDQDTYGGFPSAFRRRSLIDPALYPQGESRLPSLHDLYALAHSPWLWQDAETADGVAAVIGYILHPDYQRLEDGYGVLVYPGRRYYSAGWDIKLPGYLGFTQMGSEQSMLVQRLLLMAHFPTARRHRWYREALEHLEGSWVREGIYRFPSGYLREAPGGYWVSGNGMGLEETRRPRQALELESTFWMSKLGASDLIDA